MVKAVCVRVYMCVCLSFRPSVSMCDSNNYCVQNRLFY